MKQVACFSLFFLILFSGLSAAIHLDELKGPSFEYTTETIPMPEEWINKPITHRPENAGADLVVNLDGQMYLAWEPIIQQYAKDQNLKIITTRGTCGVSAGELSKKNIDSGAFCCPPGKTDRLPGLEYHTAGIAALTLLVHPDNPVDSITLRQAREIFQGTVYTWKDISSNGRSIPIQPVARLHCKTRPGHWRLILDNKDLFSPDLIEVGAMPDMISQVAINPGAIGYEVIWMTGLYGDKGKVKPMKINGYSPFDQEALIALNYPFFRTYNFSTWRGEHVAKKHTSQLVKYILRETGKIDPKFHIIPASRLREAGWQFRGNELTGTPED